MSGSEINDLPLCSRLWIVERSQAQRNAVGDASIYKYLNRKSPAGSGCRRGRFANSLSLKRTAYSKPPPKGAFFNRKFRQPKPLRRPAVTPPFSCWVKYIQTFDRNQ